MRVAASAQAGTPLRLCCDASASKPPRQRPPDACSADPEDRRQVAKWLVARLRSRPLLPPRPPCRSRQARRRSAAQAPRRKCRPAVRSARLAAGPVSPVPFDEFAVAGHGPPELVKLLRAMSSGTSQPWTGGSSRPHGAGSSRTRPASRCGTRPNQPADQRRRASGPGPDPGPRAGLRARPRLYGRDMPEAPHRFALVCPVSGALAGSARSATVSGSSSTPAPSCTAALATRSCTGAPPWATRSPCRCHRNQLR